MSTVAIIQARMGSSRLPGKVLADLNGKPMLCRLLDRVAAAKTLDAVAVATTTAREDDQLAAFLTDLGTVTVFRGPVDDVLSRYHECARLMQADVVVRVTADDPLKDPRIIDRAVGLLLETDERDYCSNTITPTFPEGLDIEVFRFSAINRAFHEAALPSEREHVTPYIWKHPELFRTWNFTYRRDLSTWRWTVDRPQDLDFMRCVFEHFSDDPLVSYERIIDWLDQRPDVRAINAGILRNEGYQKSLSQDVL